MRLIEIRDLDGPNIFLLEPAIKLELAVDEDDVTPDAVAALASRMEPLAPSDDERAAGARRARRSPDGRLRRAPRASRGRVPGDALGGDGDARPVVAGLRLGAPPLRPRPGAAARRRGQRGGGRSRRRRRPRSPSCWHGDDGPKTAPA